MIKLIIWDLDNTFWKGTLSEENIIISDERIKCIKKLAELGIISSICSKNDYNSVKNIMVKSGIWDYFVFPSINWNMKGNRIRKIIEMMNLREEDVLFIDDNRYNLSEALSVCPELMVSSDPEIVNQIIFSQESLYKADEKMTRLNHYKIIEKKSNIECTYSSNEKFLFDSDIHVALTEDCTSYIERIFEMINRNNQLNFTKNRMSLDEVKKIFTSSDILHGVVKVYDKFGDYGIVGCYAIKDNVLVQFVFSCRILGMQVEQYVYSVLEYPYIEVIGDVAVDLVYGKTIPWINQNEKESTLLISETDSIKIVVYGYCPLKPIYSYIERTFPDTFFYNIETFPSACNLSAIIKEREEVLNYWSGNVNYFNSNTFNKNIVDKDINCILISFNPGLWFYKYTLKNGSYFYSLKLSKSTCGFFENEVLSETKMTEDDIYNELKYIAKHLKDKKIIIQMMPEVLFPNGEKQLDEAIRINRAVIKAQIEFNNILLLDIRKYTLTTDDFFDYMPEHFNREIGYLLYKDLLQIIGCRNGYEVSVKPVKSFLKSENTKLYSKDISYNIQVINCELNIQINCDFEYSVLILRNNQQIYAFRCKNRFHDTIKLAKSGEYQVRISIDDKEVYTLKKIDFNCLNMIGCLDNGKKNFYDAFNQTKEYLTRYELDNHDLKNLTDIILKLTLNNISIVDYFKKQNITHLAIVTNNRIGRLLLPFFSSSEIKIRIYSDDLLEFNSDIFNIKYNIYNIEDVYNIDKNYHILFAVSPSETSKIYNISKYINNKKHYLKYILTFLYTKKHFVCDILNNKKSSNLFFVKTPDISHYGGFPFCYVRTAEKQIMNQNSFIPEYEIIENGIQMIKDYSSKGINIKNGIRKVINEKLNAGKKIYVFGGAALLGAGVEDNKTITAFLQKFMIDYEVICYSNYYDECDFSKAIKLYESLEIKDCDIAIFIIDFWRMPNYPYIKHWLNLDALKNAAEIIDVFPIFIKHSNEELFLSNNSYTEKGNFEIAKEIANHLKTKGEN